MISVLPGKGKTQLWFCGGRLGLVTAPRQILPGSSYFVTRRCTQRQFLLSPSPETNANVEYCLALAAQHTGIVLHAVCVMSNHWHGVLTDPHARLPEFLERFHRLLAKAQNALLQRSENLWSSEKTSVVLLASDDAVLDKMAYTMANPTSAGLVSAPHEWPGVIGSCDHNPRRTVGMPRVFFDEHGELPKATVLEFVRPSSYPGLTDARLTQALREAIERLISRGRERFTDCGFVGADVVCQQSPTAAPTTPAVLGTASPRVAAKSPAARIGAIERILSFARAYREAWVRWREGARSVLFPAGTYALRVHCGVACVPT